MTDYSRTNFEDIEPLGDGSGPVDGRFSRKFLDSRELGMSRFRYAPNAKPGFGHRHGGQEEVYVVVAGSGRMRLDDEIIDVKEWDVIRVAPGVIRGFQAGPDGLDLVIAGGDRPPEGDGEMVRDWWTD